MVMTEKLRVRPVRMIRFVCSRCSRPLVWAEASVSVQCPSCGRWVKANPFWISPAPKKNAKKEIIPPEQLLLF